MGAGIPDPVDIPEGGWKRIRGSLWVRPPDGQPVRLCLLIRTVRQGPNGPSVVGEIVDRGRRWVLYDGRWAEVPT